MDLLRRARLQALRAALSSHPGNVPRKSTAHRSQLPGLTGSLSVHTVSGISSVTAPVPLTGNGEARKIFVQHAFYKGKSVLRMSPLGPEFKVLQSGDAILEREGCVFLEFAPAIGVRQYDWNRKQMFALSVQELGRLLGLKPNEGCEFFHDPHVGKSDAGKVRKTLKVEPKEDMSGYLFNFSKVDEIDKVNEHITVLVSRSEYMVMKSAINYIIPHLMGWHTFCNRSYLTQGIGTVDATI